MTEQWIREGFSSYYVVKKEKKLTYEKSILRYHTLTCLLPCEFRMQDEEEYYYYETGIYIALKDRINKMDPKLFFTYLLEVFEETESYLLDLDHLKLETELLFLDKEDRPILCYLPEYEKNIFEQLRDFLEECIEMISDGDKKKVRFYYEFHSFLVKEKPNMEQMKSYLEIRPKVEKQKIEEKKQETEQEIEEESYEEYKNDKKINKGSGYMIWKIFCIIVCIVSAIGTLYFTMKVFTYGFYYYYFIGFAVCVTGIFASVYIFCQLWKKEKMKDKNVDVYLNDAEHTILLEDRTTLLEDDDKTVLLMEQPIGKLIPKNKKLDDIILSGNEFIIGSAIEGTDHQIEGTGISRRHLKFYKEDTYVCCEDLDSTNGVKVNGKKIIKAVLHEDDWIQIGLEVFIFKEGERV